jgi:sugar phosphate permease
MADPAGTGVADAAEPDGTLPASPGDPAVVAPGAAPVTTPAEDELVRLERERLVEGRGHGSFRWWVLAATAGGAAVFSALRMGLPSLGPAMRSEFGLSLSEVGIAYSAIGAGVMITLIPWGMLADRTGERSVLTAGLVGTGLALMLTAIAPSYGLFVLGILLAGALGASTTGASGRAVMGWFGWRERGFALGIRQMALPLGGAVGAVGLPALAIAGGLELAFFVLAAAMFVAAVVCVLVVREAPATPAVTAAPTGIPPSRDPRLWRLSVASGLLVLPQVSLLGFMTLFLVDKHRLTDGVAALLLGVVQVVGALGRLRAGRVSDRAGRRIEPMRRRALSSAGVLVVLAALAYGPLGLVAPLLIAACVATMTWNGLSFTAAAEITGYARAGTAMSMQNTVVAVGTMVGPPLFGALVELTSYPVGFVVAAVPPLVAWFVLHPLLADEETRVEVRDVRLAEQAASLAESDASRGG